MTKKFWNKVLKSNLTYSQAIKVARYNFFTREEWAGVHFVYNNHYYILLKDGTIIEDPIEVYDTAKEDWMLVDITDEAVIIINKYLEEV